MGAPYHDNSKGAIYIFDVSGALINKVMDPNGREGFWFGHWFGQHVDVSNNYIAVRTTDNVFIYSKKGEELAKRRAPGSSWYDVALLDDILVVHDEWTDNIILMKHKHSFADPSPAPSVIDGVQVTIEIKTDRWGDGTSWEITQSGNLLVSGDNYLNRRLYVTQERLPYGCYDFTIYDSASDGMCCLLGISGYYKLFVNDELEFEGGPGDWSERSMSFCGTVEG